MSKFVNSKIKFNIPILNKLDKMTTIALEETTEALHSEIENDQVVPYGKDIIKQGTVIHQGGNMNRNIYASHENSNQGKNELIAPDVYARRMYYHPEYNFNKEEHKNAKGKWYEDYISGSKKNFCSKKFSEIYRDKVGLQ